MDWLQNLHLQNIFGNPQSTMGLPKGVTPPFNPNAPSPFGTPDITPRIKPFGEPSPMFQAQPMPDVNSFEQPSAPTPDAGLSRIAQMMKQLYSPEDEMSNRMRTMIDEFPTRDKPGWLKRISASVIGGLDSDTKTSGRDLLDRGYNRKLTDWKDKFDPVHKAATLERQSNTNERTNVYQTISAQLRDEAEQHRVEKNERDFKIKQQRADIYEYKAKNPDAKLVFPKGGFVTSISDGKATIVRGADGQPIETGTLSDGDKAELMQNNAMERIAATGDEARRTEGVRQQGREDIQSQKGWSVVTIPDPNDPTKQIGVRVNAETGEVQPIKLGDKTVGPVTKTSGDDKGETATQKKVREFLAARQLVNTMPEFKKWIKFNGVNDFRITPPGGPTLGGWGAPSGPTQEEYDMMHQAIYGTPPSTSTTQSNKTSAPTNTSPKTNVTQGKRVNIYDNAGKLIGSIPDTPGQRVAAQKKGYKVK